MVLCVMFQPQVLLGLPCYNFNSVEEDTLVPAFRPLRLPCGTG
jgi:hypothetical protein